jgi:hypothetical protein
MAEQQRATIIYLKCRVVKEYMCRGLMVSMINDSVVVVVMFSFAVILAVTVSLITVK